MRSIAEMSQSFDCPLSAWADAGSVSWLVFLSLSVGVGQAPEARVVYIWLGSEVQRLSRSAFPQVASSSKQTDFDFDKN